MRKIKPLTNVIFTVIGILISLLTVLPLLFTVIISFSSEASIARKGYSFIPLEWSADSYRYLMSSIDSVGRAFIVSVAVTMAVVISLFSILNLPEAITYNLLYAKTIV